MTQTLDYDRSHTPRPMIWLHRVALVCGVVPMVVGIAVFLLFLITRHLDFAIFGFVTILGGCAAAFVGAVCIGVYWFQSGRAAPDERAIARRRAKRDPPSSSSTFRSALAWRRSDSGSWITRPSISMS